jgi:SNF2 family DNA or RNA helicase
MQVKNTARPEYFVICWDGQIYWWCRFEMNSIAKSIPGARWDRELRVWKYPATPVAAATIAKHIQSEYIHPDVLAMANTITEAAAAKQMSDEELPDHPSGIPSWTHQKRAFQFAKNLPAVGLFMEMGSGKTKVAVDLITNRSHKQTLVVCPKSAMVDVWVRQVPMYSHIPIDVVVLNGSTAGKKMEQAKAALAQAEEAGRPIILVVNYESVWREPLGSFLKQAKLDCVVLDESHRIKSPGSRVSLYCAELGKRVPHRMALTGTPAHNSPLDVYAQYRFLDPGVFGTNFSAFRNRYAVMGGYGGYQVIAYRISPTLPDGQPNSYYSLKLDREFQERMYSIAFRVRTGDVLDLPPEMDEERRFDLSNSARKIYTKLYKDMIADVGSGKVTVTNALTRLLRLQQITSGFLPVEDDKDDTTNLQQIDTGKQELLADLLEDLPAHEPLVVFFRFTHDADVIRQKVEAAGRRYYELSGQINQLKEWKTERPGDLPASVIAVQIRAGGAGVDLTRACYCVYYSLGFSLGDYDQSRRRINRPGQTRPVRFYHLIANGTVDEKVYAALKTKIDVVSYIVDGMKLEAVQRW